MSPFSYETADGPGKQNSPLQRNINQITGQEKADGSSVYCICPMDRAEVGLNPGHPKTPACTFQLTQTLSIGWEPPTFYRFQKQVLSSADEPRHCTVQHSFLDMKPEARVPFFPNAHLCHFKGTESLLSLASSVGEHPACGPVCVWGSLSSCDLWVSDCSHLQWAGEDRVDGQNSLD